MSNNEYSKLKKCIVGRDLGFDKKYFDLTFKLFFNKNLKETYYGEEFINQFTSEILKERNDDLDNLAKILESYNVKVYRPKTLDKIKRIITPEFENIITASSNVRDLTFIYNKTIYETSISLRGRFFENYFLNDIFKELYFNENFNWIKSPTSFLNDENIDKLNWDSKRDYKENIQFDILFDAANMIKLDNDIIYNYSSYNHYNAIKWLKMNINANIYCINLTDNHIDGNIVPIGKETLLINENNLKNSIEFFLPEKFKKFKLIKVPKIEKFNKNFIASPEGMSINVLNLDEKTIIINKEHEKNLGEILYKNGFNVIPVQLRYCEAFGGGIHCSTLDLERE